MAEPAGDRGFIVHAVERARGGRMDLAFIGRLESGESFAAWETRCRPFLHIRVEDEPKAAAVLKAAGFTQWQIVTSDRHTMDGDGTARLESSTSAELRRICDALHREGIRTYEADVKAASRFLMDRHVRGTVEVRGAWRPGKRVKRLYENAELYPAEMVPALSVLSMDIETSPRADSVYAVSLVFRNYDGKQSDEVLLRGTATGAVRCFDSEKALLEALRMRILSLDPDIITGWNVIDFDFAVLSRRFAALGVPFDIGRSDSPARFLSREVGDDSPAAPQDPLSASDTPRPPAAGTPSGAPLRWKRSRALVDGRQVIDGMWLTRMAGLNLEDYRLETVAQTLLGRGKRIDRLPEESGTQAIERLYRTDPAGLADYCLEDSRLVLEILDKENLMDLAVAKSLLIGTPLDQTGASVVAFETLYLEHLHARGFVAPTLGIDQGPLDRTPGGGIITPRAGLYEGVLVFDFKSLYPSLMRTFNIDPLSRVARESGAASAPSDIVLPNGERFRREPGIIPQILDRFFESRARAKREGNRAATYAYKIVMNSFYGVLGTPGCRFASSALAGAITTLGQHILFWMRDRARARGYEVIYGDTDSLFVLASGATAPLEVPTADPARLTEIGDALCAELNKDLAVYLRAAFNVESRLELEFEGSYVRFFLPPMRTLSADSDEGTGRAKGYAGLRRELKEGQTLEELDIVGMEAVRHDWTPLAQELQKALLGWVFHDVPPTEIQRRLSALVRDVREGRKDGSLVYRKALRKSVEAYTKASPPHARAAALLPPEERTGLIRYVWTTQGPQPESRLTAPPDYEHYVQKQIRPILDAVAPFIGLDLKPILDAAGQLELF